MKRAIFVLLISVLCMQYLGAQVNFEYLSSIQKIDPADELINIQLFDFNEDGDDEVIASYNANGICRIVCYSQNGDTLNTFTTDIGNEIIGYSFATRNNSNEKLLLLISYIEYSNEMILRIFDYENFSLIDSTNYFTQGPLITGIKDVAKSYVDSTNMFYIGVELFYYGAEEVNLNCTYKFTFSDNILQFVEEISDYGCDLINYSNHDSLITAGEYVSGGIGVWPYTNKSYKMAFLSDDSISTVEPVFSISGGVTWSQPPEWNHYPWIFKILSINDLNYQNYGLIVYYEIKDTDKMLKHFINYNPSFTNVLWHKNDSEINIMDASNTATCVSVNSEDHYVMYFSENEFEIRNRTDGEIVHSQTSNICPFKILRNSNDSLMFFVKQDNNEGYDVYQNEPIYIAIDELAPENVSFLKNYPNPFHKTTTFSYSGQMNLDDESIIKIYNVKGQLIINLPLATQSQSHKVLATWDGTDNFGHKVSSGLYFYQVKSGKKVIAENRCLLLR